MLTPTGCCRLRQFHLAEPLYQSVFSNIVGASRPNDILIDLSPGHRPQ
jgi:hypothetical protein